MALTSITGSRLKKMVMKASGTKGFMSDSVQKHLVETKTKRFLNENTKVTRQQATKIMKSLKAAGLAHKVTSNATSYVNKSFAKEEHRQDMIKKQNVAERNKEISAEKAAEQVKTGKATPTAKPIRSVNLARGSVSAIGGQLTPNHELVGDSFGSTNLKPAAQIKSQLPVPQKEDEPLDLAID